MKQDYARLKSKSVGQLLEKKLLNVVFHNLVVVCCCFVVLRPR